MTEGADEKEKRDVFREPRNHEQISEENCENGLNDGAPEPNRPSFEDLEAVVVEKRRENGSDSSESENDPDLGLCDAIL